MPKIKSPIWHPFTQHALQGEMTKVVRADGAYLHTADGRRIIDAISSWWVVTHGHCHPHIVSAIQEQAGKLNQIIFAGYTHDPAEELAAQLLKVAPRGLDYVFFSDSGSTSVEVALKMALGYSHNIGQQRRRIVVMQHSYHGDTVGAMSVGARGGSTRRTGRCYSTLPRSRSQRQAVSRRRSLRSSPHAKTKCQPPFLWSL